MPGVIRLNPDCILYDEDGHPVGIVEDNGDYRLLTTANSTLYDVAGNAIAVEEDVSGNHQLMTVSKSTLYDINDNHIDSLLDQKDGIRRLAVEAKAPRGQSIIIGNAVTENLDDIVRSYADNLGAIDMKVNGEETPVEFIFPAAVSGYDIALYEIRFLFGAQDILFEGDKFGSLNELTGGVTVDVVAEAGTTRLAEIYTNEDFLMFPTPANVILNNTGPKDILSMGMSLGGAVVLRAGTSDKVVVTINDDLVTPAISTFRVQIYGIKEH